MNLCRKTLLPISILVLGVACTEAPEVAQQQPEKPTNVILVIVDALRADRLGCYGSEDGFTPEIDALARNGLLFTSAYSNATFTFPSTASLFTSTLPPVHRISHDPKRAEMMRQLSNAYVLLPEVFKDAGYTTALITFPGWVSPTANYLQGVDVWTESERSDTELLQASESFITEHADEPFFLYLHFIEMHDYYHSEHLFGDADLDELEISDNLKSLAGMKPSKAYDILAKVLNQPGGLTEADLAYMQAAYGRGLVETDRVIGELARHLESLGLTDSTVLAITADHGEQFGEHGRLVHGGDAYYNELIHIPFVVSNPRLYPEPVVATTPITSIDFAPTLLDLVGLSSPSVFQGEDMAHRYDEDRVVFATDGRTWKALNREWSYIYSKPKKREELYNLVDDPGETKNVLADYPEVAAAGRAQIKQMMAESLKHPYLALEVGEVKMDEEQIERLRSLGYLE